MRTSFFGLVLLMIIPVAKANDWDATLLSGSEAPIESAVKSGRYVDLTPKKSDKVAKVEKALESDQSLSEDSASVQPEDREPASIQIRSDIPMAVIRPKKKIEVQPGPGRTWEHH